MKNEGLIQAFFPWRVLKDSKSMKKYYKFNDK